jgi:4-diphosphocytidyl-2-C-methyl-D-erythritol kinase
MSSSRRRSLARSAPGFAPCTAQLLGWAPVLPKCSASCLGHGSSSGGSALRLRFELLPRRSARPRWLRASADVIARADADGQERVLPGASAASGSLAEPAGADEVAAKATEDPVKWDLELASPSKINLFLRVLSRRDDGYHELASLFQAISLHDEMFFARLPEDAEADELECSAPGVPSDQSNLVIKALDTFRHHTGKQGYFRVRLDKRVPAQAGLGGGSGNAATALWAANQLCGKPCSVEDLARFGAEFGSDVSFFFSMGAAYCTGRGDVLQDIEPLLPEVLWLIKPKEGLSTAAVFGALKMDETSDTDPLVLLAQMQEGYLFTADFVNDLEKPSFALEPRLGEIKKALENSGFNRVAMSGSGTCFFCIGEPDHGYFGEKFAERFSFDHDVEIMRAMFLRRKHPDYWYMQSPSEDEMRAYLATQENTAGPYQISTQSH